MIAAVAARLVAVRAWTHTDNGELVKSALRTFAVALALVAAAPAAAHAAPPDPLDRGPYTPVTIDPLRIGTVNLQEPNAAGGGLTGAAAAATLQLRGSLYYPADRASGSPVIVLVHGNHSSCDSGSAPNCTAFKRNDRGYAYMGENLATWGYTVVSIDQDQLMYYQDGSFGKGMHQRRLIIAAMLDALYDANQAPIPDGPNTNIGGALVGKLDFSRVGLMGHSRGGDAVTSFIDYNRTRPAPGRRYNLRGVISLAPVDYERRAPWGVPYMTILPYCDGDVSNLQGARFFERSQYIAPSDPFPRIQVSVLGTNHNWYNSVWFVDGDDSGGSDAACARSQPNNIRLSGGLYTRDTRGSGDPALMGDQMKQGLATMNAFFRRYVGGEVEFDPYMTGELSEDGVTPQLPASACPSADAAGTRIPCIERVMTSYFPAPAERLDLIRPEPDNPLTVSALGTALTGSGFSNPYLPGGGINPLPPTTPGGYDWCNPEPLHFSPSLIGVSGLPTAAKGCPLPAANALGGQSGVRESAPVNHSYGLQLALAWDQPASLSTRIPAAYCDARGFKALALGAAVNFFDPRNPPRGSEGIWNPAVTTQDFDIVLVDKHGTEGAVSAGSPRYGNALHQTTGGVTNRTHIVLNQIRVPLSDFAAQGVDLSSLRKIELRFGGPGKPATGSIQIADVRFQESVNGPTVYTDKLAAIPPTPRAAGTPAAATPADDEAPAAGTPTRVTSASSGGADTAAGAGSATATGAEGAATPTGSAPTPVDAAACSKAAATIASTKVVGRRLTVKGSVAGCVTAVKVTVTRPGGRTTTIRAKLAGTRFTAATKLASGRFTVKVAPIAPAGVKASAAKSKKVTVR
jgi:hypothetical protein